MSESDLLDQQESSNTRRNPFKSLVVIVLLSLFIVGALFKIMHWPGHALLQLGSIAGLTGYSLALLLFEKNTTYSLVMRILNVGLMLYFTWEIFFKDGFPIDAKTLIIYTSMFIAAPLFFILEKRVKNRKDLTKQKNHF